MNDTTEPEPRWEDALDAALGRAVRPPSVPAQFRAHLQAALLRAREGDGTSDARRRLEREHRERLKELEAGYLRLRRRTLGAVIGGAFAAGIAVPLVLPWFNEHFGRLAPVALASVGGAIGLCIGVQSLLRAREASPYRE